MSGHFWNSDRDEVSRDDLVNLDLDLLFWTNDHHDTWIFERREDGRWSVQWQSIAHWMATHEAWRPFGNYPTLDAAIDAVVRNG